MTAISIGPKKAISVLETKDYPLDEKYEITLTKSAFRLIYNKLGASIIIFLIPFLSYILVIKCLIQFI